MCGLSGVLSVLPHPISVINQSLTSIKHRGEDDTLIFEGETKKFYLSPNLSNSIRTFNYETINDAVFSSCQLGFNRLSIIDASPKAMQPFYDEESGLICMINGEIYNYIELKEKYKEQIELTSQSDTEVAFKLYILLGNSFIELLRGMFCIVIYNSKENVLKVWRDRIGMKPFYYYISDGLFIFSSEMRGILSTHLLQEKLNYQGIAYSMYLGTCPAPLTIYKNINSLLPGHYLKYDKNTGNLFIKQYWRLTYKNTTKNFDSNELAADMENLAKLHITGEVKKAIMLSGGMDSGILSYHIAQADKGIEAISLSLENSEEDEADYAMENAANAKIKISLLKAKPDILTNNLEDFILTEEEPNTGAEPAFFISELAAKQNIKVLYCALGPDELFGGYNYYKIINKAKKIYWALKFIPSLLIPAKHRQKLSLIKKHGLASVPFSARERIKWELITDYLAANNEAAPVHPVTFIIKQAKDIYPDFEALPILKKISWLDIHYYIGSHHTFRSDQPSMKFGIEMRFPYLDHLFIQKYFNERHTFRGLNKHSKPLVREVAKNILPKKVMQMQKRGFRMPFLHLKNISNDGNTNVEWYMMGLNKILKNISK